jgi:phytoene desaturase
MGGMHRISQALAAIAEKLGVQIVYDAHVEQILIAGDRATGVRLDDDRVLPADLVVANADLGYVYRCLLPDKAVSARLDRMEYGCSTIMFYWGLDRQYPELGPHNLFLNGDYRQSFDVIFKKKSMPENPNFYIHAPGRIDPSVAPAGHDAWYVAVPVGNVDEFDNEKEGETNKFWHAMQHKARAYILQRLGELGFPEVESHIREEVSFVPQWWQNRYNLTLGSTHGLSHKITQMAYMRPHNRHSRYRNLYFVGASTHPGTGVPTVLISARLAAERILEEAGR